MDYETDSAVTSEGSNDAADIETPAVHLAQSETDFAFGIEEEYFLADAETMEVASETPDELFRELSDRTDGRGGRESRQAQIEVCTKPHSITSEARAQLASTRCLAAEVAEKHGLAILASGTHPSADWTKIDHSASNRYETVMSALQMIGRRNMLCGMHVHVELPDPDRRIDVMRRFTPFIPLFIALSTSSPFWHGRLTGLKGYRLAAYDELPRAGIPDLFSCHDEYDRYVKALVDAKAIPDATHIWWTVRSSTKYPTLELRAPDCCTRIDDAIALACFYRVLVRHLFRNPSANADVNALTRAITVENKWTAQRFGIEGTFATEKSPLLVSEMLDAAIAMVSEDADALDCAQEIGHLRTIIAEGTSADRQCAIYDERQSQGHDTGLRAVSQWIAKETIRKC